jgi:hypothetical protein
MHSGTEGWLITFDKMYLMDNNELFDKLFTPELQVGFLIPKMIKVLDGLAGIIRRPLT